MNTASIIIEKGRVIVRPTAGGIWLTKHQISGIFDVFVSAVGANIRSILKNEVLREEEVCRHQQTESGGILTLYNMEMITALSFRLKSRQAQQFRRWIISQAVNPVVLWKIPGMDTTLN